MTEYIIVKKPKRRARQEDTADHFNLVDVLRQKQEEAEFLDKYIKDREKLGKKEEKKEIKGHTFTFAEGILLAYLAQLIIGPLYKLTLAHWGIL